MSLTKVDSAMGNTNSAVKTTTYSILADDELVLGDVSGGAFTMTLPTAVGRKGKRYRIIQTGAVSTNALTIATTSSQTLGGTTAPTSRKMFSKGEMYEFQSDGANWQIVNRFIPSDEIDTGACTFTATTTPTVKGTFAVDKLYVSRIGDKARFRYEGRYTSAGSATTGDILFGLPTAYPLHTSNTFYTTVEGAGGFNFTSGLGSCSVGFQSAANGIGVIVPYNANKVRMAVIQFAAGSPNTVGAVFVGDGGFDQVGTSGYYTFDFMARIVDWEG
jgi:hypothetical protein